MLPCAEAMLMSCTGVRGHEGKSCSSLTNAATVSIISVVPGACAYTILKWRL